MATYRLETPQGEIVVQHPQSGLSLDQVLGIYNSRLETATAQRLTDFETGSKQAFQNRIDTAEQIAMSREASLLDYAQEVPKGIVAGAANIVESSLLGLASLAPENFEDNILRPAIQAGGDAVQGYLSADYNRGGTLQDSAIRKLSEAGGSFAGILGASVVNPYLGVGVAVGAGAGEARERARTAGATRGQINTATLGGGFVGALDVLPIKFLQSFGKGGVEKIIDRVARVISQSGVEAGQEAAASILQNAIAKGVYNPEQDLFEGTAEEAALGGSVGAIVQTIVELATPRKRGGSTSLDSQDTDQGELFPEEDLGQAPTQLLLEGPTPFVPAKAANQALRPFQPPKRDAQDQRDMISELEATVADEGARDRASERDLSLSDLQRAASTKRSGVAAQAAAREEAEKFFAGQNYTPTEKDILARINLMAKVDQVGAYEQPDLFAQELEREERRLGPKELRNPEQFMDDLEAVMGEAEAKPASPERRQIDARKRNEDALAAGIPAPYDLVDLAERRSGEAARARVFKTKEEARQKQEAIDVDTDLGLREMEARITEPPRRTADRNRPEQLSLDLALNGKKATPVVKSVAEGKDLSALQNRLGEDDVKVDRIEPGADGASIPTPEQNVADKTKRRISSNARTKSDTKELATLGSPGVGSVVVDLEQSDGTETGQSDTLDNPAFEKKAIEQAAKQNEASREILVDMPIADFLAAAKKETSPAKLAKTKKLLAKGTPFNSVPSLSFENNGDGTGTVVGHDGRNRAIALAESGVTTMPVRLTSSAGKGPSIRWGKQNDPTDRDYVETLPQTLIEQEGTAIVNMPNRAKRVRALQTIPKAAPEKRTKPALKATYKDNRTVPSETSSGRDATPGKKTGKKPALPIPEKLKEAKTKRKAAEAPAKKDTSAQELVISWNETKPQEFKDDYVDNTDSSPNPFKKEDNQKISAQILKGTKTLSETEKVEVAPIIAYLSRYPNPFQGIKQAAYDVANATPMVKVGSVKDLKTGELIKDVSEKSRIDTILNKNMGGVGRAKTVTEKVNKKTEAVLVEGKPVKSVQPSPAARAIAWVRANLSEDANELLNKEITRVEENANRAALANRDATNAEDRVLLERLAKAAVERQKQIDLVGGQYLTPKQLVKDGVIKANEVDKLFFYNQEKGEWSLALSADAVVGLDVPMHPTVEQAIKKGDLVNALVRLASTAPNNQLRTVAKVYASLSGTTKLVIQKDLKAKDGRPVAGLFDPKTNTISLDTKTGINTHTIIHEMTHAVTSAGAADPKNAIAIQLTKLLADVKDSLGTAYGAQNIQEFLAESQGNTLFRAELASINMKGEPITVFQRFRNIINNFLSQYLPFIKSKNLTSLAEVDSLVEALLAPAPKYRNANQMAMMSTSSGVKEFGRAVIDKTQKSINADSRKQLGYDVSDFLKLGFSRASQRILLGLQDMQGLSDTARSVGLKEKGVELDVLTKGQRGAIQEASRVIESQITKILEKLRTGTPAQGKKRRTMLDDLIYNTEYGATIYQVDPNRSRKDYMVGTGAKFDRDGNDLLEVYDKLKTIWDDPNFGKEGREAFNDMREVYRIQYEKLRKIVTGQIDSLLSNTSESKNMRNKMLSKLFDKASLEVYFPLMREGNFVLKYNTVESTASVRRDTVIQTFTTDAERNVAFEIIKADKKYKDVTKGDNGVTSDMFKGVADAGFAFETIKILEAAKDKNGAGLEAEVINQIMQLYVTALPETSLAKSLQKRVGYPGYMQDSILALTTKGYSIATQTAKLEYGAKLRQFKSEVNQMELNEADVKTPTSRVGKVTRALTAPFEDVKNELLDRATFAIEGAKTSNFEGIVRRVNQTAFIYTIGFNASSAVVNLSQIPLFVTPYLAGKYDSGVGAVTMPKTRAALRNAYSNTALAGKKGGRINSIRDFYDVSIEGEYTLKSDLTVTAEKRVELKNMTALVKTAANSGLLGQGYTAEAMGLNEAGRLKQGGRLGNALDNVSILSAWLFNHAEQLNRQVTLMASFNLALDKSLNGAKPETATQEQIDKAVEEAIYDTQQTNGGTFLETAPKWARSGAGRVAFMYKSYGLRMYHTMFQTAKIAFDRDNGKLFGPEGSPERRAAWKQLIGMHGAALFFAGVQGLPLYGAVRLMYNLYYGDDDEDFDTIVRTHIGEGWFKGPITKYAGVDTASRMALTGLLIADGRYLNQPSVEENIGLYLGGPALSVGKRLVRGVSDLTKGEYQLGIEKILPAGIANAYKASPIGRYGEDSSILTRRGDPIVDDLTFGNLAAQFLGFPPTEYTFAMEQRSIIKGIDIAVGKQRSALHKRYYIATRNGRFSELDDIGEDITAFNEKHPEAAITTKSIERSLKQHAKTSEEMISGVSITYKKAARDLIDEYYGQ